jgi:hypothetical protein
MKVNLGYIDLSPEAILDTLTDFCERAACSNREAVESMVARNPGCSIGYICARLGPDFILVLRAVRQLKAMGHIRERQSGGYEIAAAKS